MKIKEYLIALTLVCTINLVGNTQTSVTVREKAPEINITHWIENIPEDKSLEGKSIVLEFWATWCAGCIEAVPHLNELKAQFDPKDIMFLSITDESQEKIERAIKRIHFETTVVCDNSEKTHMGYGENGKRLRGIPKTILIDKEGIVKYIGQPMEVNKSMLDKLIKGDDIPAKEKFVRKIYGIIDDTNEEAPIVTPKNSVTGPTSQALDFREATEAYTVEKRMLTQWTYINHSLQDIYTKLLNRGKNDVDIPVELQNKKYSFDYKFNDETPNIEILEQEILSALNLEKATMSRKTKGVNLYLIDKSKLESALNKIITKVSVGDDKLLMNGVTLKQFEDAINARMDEPYSVESYDTEKYDFILNIKDKAALLASLESYGITSETSTIEVEKIKLTLKE